MRAKKQFSWPSGKTQCVVLLLASGVVGGYLLSQHCLPSPRSASKLADNAARTHARRIAALYDSAQLSGAELNSKSVEGVLGDLEKGVRGYGRFAGSVFRIQKMDPGQSSAVRQYLTMDRPEGEVDVLRFLGE